MGHRSGLCSIFLLIVQWYLCIGQSTRPRSLGLGCVYNTRKLCDLPRGRPLEKYLNPRPSTIACPHLPLFFLFHNTLPTSIKSFVLLAISTFLTSQAAAFLQQLYHHSKYPLRANIPPIFFSCAPLLSVAQRQVRSFLPTKYFTSQNNTRVIFHVCLRTLGADALFST